MSHPFIYVGCFFKYEDFQTAIKDIRKSPLKNDVRDPHITFMYKPKEVIQSLFGEVIHVTIVGYGNDGTNEGLRVQLKANNPDIQFMINNIAVPHITIAVSDEGKPVNTKDLNFESINPIKLEGKYGGFAKWGRVIVTN